MIDILLLFGPSTLMAILISLPLSLCGPHYCARGQHLELLPMAQLAYFVFHLIALLSFGHNLPELFLFILQLVTSLFVMKIARRLIGRNDLKILATYLIAMTADFALLTLFPKIDGHLSSHLFGDIVTVGGELGMISTFLALTLLGALLIGQSKYLKETINFCLFKEVPRNQFFEWMGLTALAICLYNLGPIHTLAVLILPSLFLNRKVRGHGLMITVSITALIFSCIAGMLTSSLIERLPSVTIVTNVFALSLFLIGALIQVRQTANIKSA